MEQDDTAHPDVPPLGSDADRVGEDSAGPRGRANRGRSNPRARAWHTLSGDEHLHSEFKAAANAFHATMDALAEVHDVASPEVSERERQAVNDLAKASLGDLSKRE